MGEVFADLGMSLDGFIAGPNAGPENALGDGGNRIHEWQYRVAAWRERLGRGGGDVDRDNEIAEEKFARTGAYVMGRRMFDEGEVGWPDPPRSARRSSCSRAGRASRGHGRATRRSPS